MSLPSINFLQVLTVSETQPGQTFSRNTAIGTARVKTLPVQTLKAVG